MKTQLIVPFFLFILAACSSSDDSFDASGTFEADEVIVSSETTGRILHIAADEGSQLGVGTEVALIDTTGLYLQSEQIEATIQSLQQKTADPVPYMRTLEQQMQVQKTQLASLEKEQARIARLVKDDAATTKQLDDIVTQVEVMRQQIELTGRQLEQTQSGLNNQNRGVLSESGPLEMRKAQLREQLDRSKVLNPVAGTVLTRYAEQGEMTSPGKALYKIADLRTLTLRAYISGSQLPEVKIGQPVRVYTDRADGEYDEHKGTLTWISDKAEFTPKTIQTRDERANLVYAVKIKVPNTGSLKIGMYGEVRF
jgi:HlyD family secretion protein